MIDKVVIPAAGLGTRLFPATKEQPKEMLPIFCRLKNGSTGLKPLVHLVFEQLHDAGFRKFCFVVGRGKRGIEDHFTPDMEGVYMLKEKEKTDQANDLESFYSRIKTSTILWVNQPEAKGFGNAVLMAQPFVQNDKCLVHAGDTYIISRNSEHLKHLIEINERLKADVTFIVQEIEDPRQYGVIEGNEIGKGVYRVKSAIEKPKEPPTNLAIMPIYIFHPVIFKALERTPPGKGEEFQLTDAIQKLINWDLKVCAIKLPLGSFRLDIGSPETYWEALTLSYQHFCGKPEC